MSDAKHGKLSTRALPNAPRIEYNSTVNKESSLKGSHLPEQDPKQTGAELTPRSVKRARALLELSALAQDVAAHLRRHTAPTVRVSAALLLTASLAACATGSPTQTASESNLGEAVAPLAGDVAGGLPQAAGTYPVQADSIFRDQKGIYEFTWLDSQQQPHNAYSSKLRLAEGDTAQLEVPSGNEDPVLRLPKDSGIRVIEESQEARSPSTTYVQHSYPWTSTWLPFAAGALIGRATAPGVPAYYNPPLGNYSTGQRIEGGRVSTQPAPPSERVIGLRSGVSGQSGGTGSGSAVSSKLGTGTTAGNTTGQTGVAPSTGSGTSGQAGGQGSGSAVTGKSGSGVGSGVTSPSSGGFSSGKGSSGSSGSSSS